MCTKSTDSAMGLDCVDRMRETGGMEASKDGQIRRDLSRPGQGFSEADRV